MTYPNFWHSATPTSTLLWPLSGLYRVGLWAHQTLRRATHWHAPIPVISVGNITVGGTGKTPLVQKIALALAAEGRQVAIISRGYKAAWRRPYLITGSETPAQVGDEPLLLHQTCGHTSVSVWVGRNRKATAQRAVTAGAQVLILDDGFQATQITRDVDLLVAPAAKAPFGNARLLPAGPLREPLHNLARASALIYLGDEKAPAQPIPTYTLQRTFPQDCLENLKQQPIIAFAGIGMPQQFFDGLKQAGLTLAATRTFADHHTYTMADAKQLLGLAKKHGAKLVCTQKDWAKLPPDLKPITTALPLELHGVDWQKLNRLIQAVTH